MKRPKNAAIAAAVTLILAALLTLSPYIVNPATAQTALPAPSLNVVAGDSSIEISWTEIEGAARYDLWAWWDEGTGWQRLANNLTDTMFSHTDVRAGVTYWYSVAAFNASGERGPYSEYASAVAPAQPSPTPLPPTATQAPVSPTPVTPGATVQSTQTPYPTYTPYPTLEPLPTYTPYPTYTPIPVAPTSTPAPTPDPSERCAIASYAAGDERWTTIKVPLIQNGTLIAYRNKYGENLDDLDIFWVNYHADGRVVVWYQGDGSPYYMKRRVGEIYRGCQFLGHTGWQDISYR